MAARQAGLVSSPSDEPPEVRASRPSDAPKERNARNLAVPLAAALLLSCASGPGLAFAERPASVAAGLLLLTVAGPGLGCLILRHTCPHLSYRVRLAAATGLGFALLAPAQLLSGLAGTGAATALDLTAAALGLVGLVHGARDWRTALPGERCVPLVTVLVTGAITLAFCIPAAREMTLAPDGSLVVQYVDMPFHAADVVALQHLPARHPFIPSTGLHYHYLLNLVAARVAFFTGLGPADALYRVVRPLAILGCLCGFAALPGLLIGGRVRRPVAWLGPAVAYGLPAVGVLWADWEALADYVRHGGHLTLGNPAWDWDSGGDMLVSVGGLGLGLLLPLMVILLPDGARSLRPISGMVLGLVVGGMLGFNAPAVALCVAGLAGAMLAELLLRRRSAVGLAVALLVALAWGFVLKGQIVGSGFGNGALRQGPPVGLAAILLGSLRVACIAIKMLHLKALLAVVALTVIGRGTRDGFLVSVVVVAATSIAAGVFGTAAAKYLQEGVALGIACLAVAGAAWLAASGREARRPPLRLLAWAALGLGLAFGGRATLQFLSRSDDAYRTNPAFTTVIRDDVSLGVACLVVAGAAWLAARGAQVRRPLLRVVAWAFIGLWLACGVLATTQFLWRNDCTYRIAPEFAASLRAMAVNLPPGAFVAGPETLVAPDGLVDMVVPARPDHEGFVSYVLRYTVVALLGRPAMIGAPDAGTFGYAPDPPAAAASAADIARLFSVSDRVEALAIARRHGVTHLLLPAGSDLPWAGVPAGPGLRLFEITGSGSARCVFGLQ